MVPNWTSHRHWAKRLVGWLTGRGQDDCLCRTRMLYESSRIDIRTKGLHIFIIGVKLPADKDVVYSPNFIGHHQPQIEADILYICHYTLLTIKPPLRPLLFPQANIVTPT